MALRLGKFSGNGAELWAGLQTDYDLWEAPQKLADELARIKTLPKSA
jgi:antitoxin HigA-1